MSIARERHDGRWFALFPEPEACEPVAETRPATSGSARPVGLLISHERHCLPDVGRGRLPRKGAHVRVSGDVPDPGLAADRLRVDRQPVLVGLDENLPVASGQVLLAGLQVPCGGSGQGVDDSAAELSG